ncbi:hypothetical protein FH972_022543 [Carpinus fangiana]|uniref:Uncharacterized protein n=1 Tax=Carpinus fangiana TaxID=176857 RepID=A0A5N6KSJ8_9ROSI|nr:hypothetical protein FH972_022543 [Carpinus fangiana]
MLGRFPVVLADPIKTEIIPTTNANEAQETSSTPGICRPKVFPDFTFNHAGYLNKSFALPTKLLMTASPFFRSGAPVADSTSGKAHPFAFDQPFLLKSPPFPDIDKFTFPLLQEWLHGKDLPGPNNWRSMTNYLSLYVLAMQFQIEPLKNKTMDLIRAYYRREDMSAPGWRLDYIYANTDGPNLMRAFLVYTAVARAIRQTSSGQATGISNSIQKCLKAGGDLAADYAAALVTLAVQPGMDVRIGNSCNWHEHQASRECLNTIPRR